MELSKRKQRLRSVLMQYGLESHRVKTYRSLYKKAAAYRVSTNKGTYCLKPFRGSSARLSGIYKRIAQLHAHHFRSLPRWIPAKNGKYWCSKGGRLYYVTEWIDGSELGHHEQDFQKLGAALGRLHLITPSLKSGYPSYTAREVNRFWRHHRRFASHLQELLRDESRISEWFQEHGAECLSLAEKSWSVISQLGIQRMLRKEKPSIIHGDVTRPNVIVRSGSVYLVDWELARPGSAYYEVAKTLNNITNFTVPHIKALLDGYESIRPLGREERMIVASLSRLPREAWVAARQIRSGRPSTIFEVLKETWGKRLEMVEWLDSWADFKPKHLSSVQPVPVEGGDGHVAGRSH